MLAKSATMKILTPSKQLLFWEFTKKLFCFLFPLIFDLRHRIFRTLKHFILCLLKSIILKPRYLHSSLEQFLPSEEIICLRTVDCVFVDYPGLLGHLFWKGLLMIFFS